MPIIKSVFLEMQVIIFTNKCFGVFDELTHSLQLYLNKNSYKKSAKTSVYKMNNLSQCKFQFSVRLDLEPLA